MKTTKLWSLAAVAGSLLAPLAQGGETNRYRPTSQPPVAQTRPVSTMSARPAVLATNTVGNGDIATAPAKTANGDKTACCSPCYRPIYNSCNPCFRTYYSSAIISPCSQPCYGGGYGGAYYGGASYGAGGYYGGASYGGAYYSGASYGGGLPYGGQPIAQPYGPQPYGLPQYGQPYGQQLGPQPYGPGPIGQPFGGGGYGPQPIGNPQPFAAPYGGPQPGFGGGPYGQPVVGPAVVDPLLQTIPVSGGYGPGPSPYYP